MQSTVHLGLFERLLAEVIASSTVARGIEQRLGMSGLSALRSARQHTAKAKASSEPLASSLAHKAAAAPSEASGARKISTRVPDSVWWTPSHSAPPIASISTARTAPGDLTVPAKHLSTAVERAIAQNPGVTAAQAIALRACAANTQPSASSTGQTAARNSSTATQGSRKVLRPYNYFVKVFTAQLSPERKQELKEIKGGLIKEAAAAWSRMTPSEKEAWAAKAAEEQ